MPLDVLIRDRDNKIYEGTCDSLTSYNAVGEFDILPTHANFISLISKAVIIDKGKQDSQKFEIEEGILSVSGDRVEIYV